MNRLLFIAVLVAIGWVTALALNSMLEPPTKKPTARARAIYALKLAAAYGYAAAIHKEPWSNVVIRVESFLP